MGVSPAAEPLVGVIGIGQIGKGVAENLCAVETAPVRVFARSEETRQRWRDRTGFAVASAKEMAQSCNAIFLVVPGTQEVRTIMLGEDGILAHAASGLLVIDLTTSDPRSTREIAAKAREIGVGYLDAGTSGGPVAADKGELILMVGGENDVMEQACPILNAIARTIYHVGPSGAGHTLKLLHNNVTFGNFLLACEAGRVAEKAGIPLARTIEVFNNSNARSYATEHRFPAHILSETWDSRGFTYLVHKDLELGAALVESADLSLGMTEAARDFVARAVSLGLGHEDFMLLYRDYEKILGAAEPAVSTPEGQDNGRHS